VFFSLCRRLTCPEAVVVAVDAVPHGAEPGRAVADCEAFGARKGAVGELVAERGREAVTGGGVSTQVDISEHSVSSLQD